MTTWVDRHQLEVAKEGRLQAGRLYRWTRRHYPSLTPDTQRVYDALREECNRLGTKIDQAARLRQGEI